MLSYRLTDRLADISTNVSENAVVAFERQGALRPGRMIVIHNGIDTRSFVFDASAGDGIRRELGIDQSTWLMLAVGRLWEPKDYPNLLRAFAGLATSTVPSLLVIAGEGPLREELDALAIALDLSDRVIFLGVRQDVPSLMSACDVFVLSSAWEGFGLVVAEAMACERPVVATDSGGVREVVGGAGFLVPPRDSKALTSALYHVQQLSMEARKRLGRTARARVLEKFSLDAMADRYLAVYQGDSPYLPDGR